MFKVISLVALMSLSASVSPALADFKLTDGVYRSSFRDGCGTLAIKGGKYAYKYASPCGGRVTFSALGRWDGKVLRIGYATFVVSSATANSIKGTWTLMSYTNTHTFRRQ